MTEGLRIKHLPGARSPRFRHQITLEPRPDAPHRARAALDEMGYAWEIPAQTADKAQLVLGELVATAIERAVTICNIAVEFDGTRVLLSVSDRTSGSPRVRLRHLSAWWRGRLQLAGAKEYGVEYLGQIHRIWAVVAPK